MTAPKKRLLVEGADDLHVVRGLMGRSGLDRAFEVDEKRGVDALLDGLPTLLKARNEQRLGIMLDADFDARAQWARVREKVRLGLNVELPDAPVVGGIVEDIDDELRLGVWMMPDNALPGRLEDFLHALVPEGDTVWPLASEFVRGLNGETRRFPPQHDAKACIHAFLAVQEEPGKPYGQAITARYLSADSPRAAEFVAWLRRLFIE